MTSGWWTAFGRGCLQFCRDTPAPIWACLAFVLLSSLWTQSLPAESDLAKHLASEEGFFEQASAAFLIAAALLAVVSWIVSRSRVWLASGIVILYAAMRELDFQTLFTYRSIMSTGYYFRDVAPPGEKIIVIFLILPCILAIAYLARYGWDNRDLWLTRSWLSDQACGPLRAWGLWMLILFGCSHIADRHPGWIAWMPGRIGTFEAVVEAGLCLAAMLLVVELKPRFLRG
jgi:hypothetical protein